MYVVEENYCRCHPETCCCEDYKITKKGIVIARSNDKEELALLVMLANSSLIKNQNLKNKENESSG
jgi:hypothetical protein